VNDKDRVKNSENLFAQMDGRINRITLKTENEFVFYVKPLLISCSTWRKYNGNWVIQNDTIIFSDQYEVIENSARFEFSNNKKKFYHLKFQTDKNSKLTEKNIEIQLIYDFDSTLDYISLNLELENDSSIKIPFKDIPNREKLASIRYKYFLPNGEKRYGYITESRTANVKVKNLQNFITVILIEQPKKETIFRTTKATLINDEIKIISTDKTNSLLPDYTEELYFKDVYQKENTK